MEKTRVLGLGMIGLVKDTDPVALPPNAWSEMQNVRCEGGAIKSFPGRRTYFSPSIVPEVMEVISHGGSFFLAYAGEGAVRALRGETETVYSGATLSVGGSLGILNFGGIGVINNGISCPVWTSDESTLSLMPYDETLTWEDVGMTAQFFSVFKTFMFAFDITDADGRNRIRLLWSHPAEANTMPASWNLCDTTKLAGEAVLSETPGFFVGAYILKDTLQIFKTDAIYSCTYTGSQYRGDQTFLFNFRPVFTDVGLLARRCVCSAGERGLFFISDSDLYLYDGNRLEPIATDSVKRHFFRNVKAENETSKVFCRYHETQEEIWIFYPRRGDDACTQALIYNIRDKTWFQRDVPNVLSAFSAKVQRPSGYTWATLPYETWADWGVTPPVPAWDEWASIVAEVDAAETLIVGSSDDGGTLYEMDYPWHNSEDGSAMTCVAQRVALDLGDKWDMHQVIRVMPLASGDPFRIRVGTHSTPNAPVVWSDYFTFDPDTDQSIVPLATGILHAIEYSSVGDVSWTVYGHEIHYVLIGGIDE